MTNRKQWLAFGLAAIIGLMTIEASAQQADKVAYPFGYRNWHHVKSMVLEQGHPLANPFGGLHHVYANPKAQKGLKSGVYEDGAILVFDLFETKVGGAAIEEGKRKLVGVMERDAKRFAGTGGWGYEGFAGDSRGQRLTTDGGLSCFGCHAGQKDTAFVFSKARN